MQIVIDIPEDDYNFVKKQVTDGITNPLKMRIANGIPLPKCHGRLIDADDISLDDIGFFSISDYQKMVHKLTTSCPTIIEAVAGGE